MTFGYPCVIIISAGEGRDRTHLDRVALGNKSIESTKPIHIKSSVQAMSKSAKKVKSFSKKLLTNSTECVIISMSRGKWTRCDGCPDREVVSVAIVPEKTVVQIHFSLLTNSTKCAIIRMSRGQGLVNSLK